MHAFRTRRTTTDRRRSLVAAIIVSCLTLGGFTDELFAQQVQPSFSYQGQLKLDDSPVNGTVDFIFTLWDNAAGGNPIGQAVPINNHAVNNGLFNVNLDFGVDAFTGHQRWLQIEVRSPAGSGAFATLTPRQNLTPAPYALALRGLRTIQGAALADRWNILGGSTGNSMSNATGSTIAGGSSNSLSGIFSVLGGGSFNAVNGNNAFLGGGENNAASGQSASVVGGHANAASAEFAAVGGGESNTAGAAWSTVPGGQLNTAAANYSFAAGRRAKANHAGSFVWADSTNADFPSIADNEVRFRATNGMLLHSGDFALQTEDNAQDQSIFFRNSGGAYTWRIYREDAGGLQASLHFAGGNSSQDYETLSNFLTLRNTGNIGIGTDTPNAPLTIQSRGGNGEWLQFRRNDGTDAWHLNNAFGGLNLAESGVADGRIFVEPGGNVGIGNLDPGMSLEVSKPSYYGAPAIGGSVPGHHAYLHVAPHHSLIWDNAASMRFGTESDLGSGYVEHMRIAPTGMVGIGTSNPQDTLDVAGIVRAQAIRLVGGADIAEPFNVRSEHEIQPGMVVAIDPKSQGDLRICSDPYDIKVAGIISGADGINPGMTLSQTGTIADGEHPVALSGRVWCLADSTNGGPIEPGDMLTTSSIPGYAMKVNDRSRAVGATIGKAMTSLDEGRGLVLVLVNLQ